MDGTGELERALARACDQTTSADMEIGSAEPTFTMFQPAENLS